MPEYHREVAGLTLSVTMVKQAARHGHERTWDVLTRYAARHAFRLGRKGYIYDGGLAIHSLPPRFEVQGDAGRYAVSFFVLIPVTITIQLYDWVLSPEEVREHYHDGASTP